MLGGVGSIGSAISDVLEEEGAIVCRHGLIGDYSGDVADFQASERMVNPILGKYGAVDILVNSVSAPAKLASFDKKTWQDFLAHFTVQLKSAVEVTQMVLPKMKERKWGRIVNISSIFGIVARGKQTMYTATKHGINGVTKALALELGPHNILVNSVCPGFTNTDLVKRNPPEKNALLAKDIPQGRFAEPIEIAELVSFLISDKNTYINGQCLVIDGGFTCR